MNENSTHWAVEASLKMSYNTIFANWNDKILCLPVELLPLDRLETTILFKFKITLYYRLKIFIQNDVTFFSYFIHIHIFITAKFHNKLPFKMACGVFH